MEQSTAPVMSHIPSGPEATVVPELPYQYYLSLEAAGVLIRGLERQYAEENLSHAEQKQLALNEDTLAAHRMTGFDAAFGDERAQRKWELATALAREQNANMLDERWATFVANQQLPQIQAIMAQQSQLERNTFASLHEPTEDKDKDGRHRKPSKQNAKVTTVEELRKQAALRKTNEQARKRPFKIPKPIWERGEKAS